MTSRQDILDYYHTTADKVYNKFNSNIVRTSLPTIGVRVPLMRQLAKQICHDEPYAFLDNHKVEYFEDALLQGFVIGGLKKCDFETLKEYICCFVPTIESWAVCDTFCGSLKRTLKEPDQFWSLIEHYLHSDKEFETRWSVVMMMSYYLTDSHIDCVLAHWQLLGERNEYYVEMAIAWGLATAFAKQPQQTLKALQSNAFSDQIMKKTVQKCRESFRISAQDKQMLKTLITK